MGFQEMKTPNPPNPEIKSQIFQSSDCGDTHRNKIQMDSKITSVCVCVLPHQYIHTASLPLPRPTAPYPVVPDINGPTSGTRRAVLPSAALRSVTLASHDILSHRQPHSSSVSSCEGAWDPATGGGHFKGRPAHSCSLSLQQPAPVCNHY